ncbi:MAG: hypothetical protein ABSC94_19570 [Polyangiaceae bacterium]|jgi:Mn-dependent DtxR family transcriptional regulator
MTFDSRVLKAMLRLARRREAAGDDEIAIRTGGTASQVRAAVRRLRASGLVEMRDGRPARLTMEGLAIALALLPSRPARPMPRSRAAASRAVALREPPRAA